MSVLQNSKEEALNTALGGDQLQFQDSGLQELVRAVISGLRNLPGNEACCDCGAPGLEKRILMHLNTVRGHSHRTERILAFHAFPFVFCFLMKMY